MYSEKEGDQMSVELNDVKNACLDKWCDNDTDIDERLQLFNDKFKIWMQQIPEENQATVLTLIENLEYYSHKRTNAWLKMLHNKLLENSNISDENTIYLFIKSKYGKTNSSNDYWTEYKLINNINKNICLTDIDLLDAEDWKYIENIVFIDDFSGSGKSFIDELKKSPGKYKNKNVYFITINTMVSATEKIESYCKDNEINIVLLSVFNQEKAFSRNFFENNDIAKNEIHTMSQIFSIPNKEIMGYDDGEALVVFYNNTPNNTLGFIRYNTNSYQSIFPRVNDKTPKWMNMKKKRGQRKNANYNNKIGSD